MASQRRLFKHSLKCNVLQSPIMTIVNYSLIKYFNSNFLLFVGGGPSAKGAGTRAGRGVEGQHSKVHDDGLVQRRRLSLVRRSVHLENVESCQSSCNSFAPVRPGRNLRVGDSHAFRILVEHVGRALFPVPAVVGWLRRPRWDRPGVELRSGCSDLGPGYRPAVR